MFDCQQPGCGDGDPEQKGGPREARTAKCCAGIRRHAADTRAAVLKLLGAGAADTHPSAGCDRQWTAAAYLPTENRRPRVPACPPPRPHSNLRLFKNGRPSTGGRILMPSASEAERTEP
jgi:hypothetical protein